MSSSRRVLGLDGLRGLAVLLVVLFHVQLGPFAGGFVGVTVFFTLSGFLISVRTASAIATTDRFSSGDFIRRRIRRLAPASVVCVAGTLIATVLIGGSGQLRSIRGDAIAAVTNLANWRFLSQGTSYADIFSGPSPLNHYWSLAIEEQFYLLFPLVAALVLRAAVGRRAAIVGGVLGLAGAWSLTVAFSSGGGDRFYYGTDARLFELLVGVALGLLVVRSRLRAPSTSPSAATGRAVLAIAAPLALAALVVLALVLDNGSDLFARGGAQLAALLTATVIMGLLNSSSPVSRALAVRPLAWVGKVSYGVYLYHWPIVALTPRSIGPVSGAPLALLQIAASLLLAALSWRFIERPVITGRTLPSPQSLTLTWAGSTAALLTAALLIGAPSLPEEPTMLLSGGTGIKLDQPVPLPPPTTSPATVASTVPPSTETAPPTTAPPTAVPPPSAAAPTGPAPTAPLAQQPAPKPIAPRPTAPAPTAPAGPPLRVAVAGDSTASVAANALKRYAAKHPTELVVLDLSMAGCTITRVTTIRHFRGEDGQNMSACQMWTLAVPQQISLFRPDVTVVFLAMMEQADQRPDPGSDWRNILDPAWADHQKSEFELLESGLASTGAPSVWADVPYMKFQPRLDWVSDDPARTDALNALIRTVQADRPEISILPFAARLNRPGRVVDTRIRPDGIHLTDRAADAMVTELLLPAARARVGR